MNPPYHLILNALTIVITSQIKGIMGHKYGSILGFHNQRGFRNWMIQWKIETKLMNKSHLPREDWRRNERNWSLNIRRWRWGRKGVWGLWWKWKEWVVILISGRGDGVTSNAVTASRSIFPQACCFYKWPPRLGVSLLLWLQTIINNVLAHPAGVKCFVTLTGCDVTKSRVD